PVPSTRARCCRHATSITEEAAPSPRHLYPRPGRGTRAPAFLLRCGDPRCATRRFRAAFSEAAIAAQARLLALAHHRRAPAAVEARAERNVAISATQSGHMLRGFIGARAEPSAYQH